MVIASRIKMLRVSLQKKTFLYCPIDYDTIISQPQKLGGYLYAKTSQLELPNQRNQEGR